MKKHRTKTGRTAFSKSLDVLVTPVQVDALKKAAEDMGVNLSVLTRQILVEYLRGKRYLPEIEPPVAPFASRRRR